MVLSRHGHQRTLRGSARATPTRRSLQMRRSWRSGSGLQSHRPITTGRRISLEVLQGRRRPPVERSTGRLPSLRKQEQRAASDQALARSLSRRLGRTPRHPRRTTERRSRNLQRTSPLARETLIRTTDMNTRVTDRLASTNRGMRSTPVASTLSARRPMNAATPSTAVASTRSTETRTAARKSPRKPYNVQSAPNLIRCPIGGQTADGLPTSPALDR